MTQHLKENKMKNIHVLPTDNKYSRLYFNINDKEFQICEIEKPSTILKPNRHIYITSDEEIKEGDYGLVVNEILSYNKMIKLWGVTQGWKVIITTDQDLIKDGAQAIDDEFLEWFVKNPNCEEVEVEESNLLNTSRTYLDVDKYKISISKEEKDYTALLKPVGTKQSAVEWLVKKYFEDYKVLISELEFEQAKEMEKQQIIDAYKNGKYESDKIVMSDRFYAEQYYNEQFKNK